MYFKFCKLLKFFQQLIFLVMQSLTKVLIFQITIWQE